jgi:anti-sigma B factor antagonist
MNIHVRHTDKAAVLTVKGPLKLGHSEHDFRDAFEDLLDQGTINMVVNLAGVPEIDSSGVGALMRVFTSAKRAGGRVCYFGTTKRVMQMLKMVRLDNVLELFEDEESALRSF